MGVRRQPVTRIQIYIPLGALWIIGSYALYRSMEVAASRDWATAIRSFIIGQAILIAAVILAAAVASRRPDPRVAELEGQIGGLQAELDEVRKHAAEMHKQLAEMRQQADSLRQQAVELRQQAVDVLQQLADLRQQLVLLQTNMGEQWEKAVRQAADTFQKVADDVRQHDNITSVHIVRDEHSSP